MHGDGVPQNRPPGLMTPAACSAVGSLERPAAGAGFFVPVFGAIEWTAVMENVWLQSALWMALAFAAAMGSLCITISAALFEIVVGAAAGNILGLPLTPWIDYIAGFGAV